MEEHEKVQLVPPAQLEVNYVHDSVRLLKQVQGFLVLFPLDELDCAVVQLG